MSKALTVKVPVTKVIGALEVKLEQIKADKANQQVNEDKYEKACAVWKKQVIAYAVKNISKAENLRSNYRSWNNTLNVDFDLITKEADFPTEPVRDFVTMHDSTYRDTVDEIENALRILKMTNEETVSASTMRSIAHYL